MYNILLQTTIHVTTRPEGYWPLKILLQLIRDLGIEMIFERMIARTHSIEFQKRGFPHMHIIVWF